jgi:hypothetical protein
VAKRPQAENYFSLPLQLLSGSKTTAAIMREETRQNASDIDLPLNPTI